MWSCQEENAKKFAQKKIHKIDNFCTKLLNRILIQKTEIRYLKNNESLCLGTEI